MKELLGIKMYTLKEVGEMLGVQSATVSKYIKEGKLAAQFIGGRKYVTEENLKSYLTCKE